MVAGLPSLSTVIKATDTVRFVAHDNGGFLLDIATGRCYSLNRLGSSIFDLAHKEMSIEAMVHIIHSSYRDTPDDIRLEVQAFCAGMMSKGLLVAA